MKRFLLLLALGTAQPAFAADPAALIAACDAPVAKAIIAASQADAQSPEWSNLNLAIQQHRWNCALPMVLACHLSDTPSSCFADAITALDARAEVERQKLDTFAEAGGFLVGDLPRQRARTTPARAAEREAFCTQQSTDASTYVRVLGGDVDSACRLDRAVHQWAALSFAGAAPAALSLLPQ